MREGVRARACTCVRACVRARARVCGLPLPLLMTLVMAFRSYPDNLISRSLTQSYLQKLFFTHQAFPKFQGLGGRHVCENHY